MNVESAAMAHAAATWLMVGVIWIVQLVHYPMFAALDRAAFQQAHQFHSRSISFVVVPVMLAELLLGFYLWWQAGLPHAALAIAQGILVVIWLATFAVIVPLHDRLQRRGFCEATHKALVRWNWVRTVGWSVRGLLVLALM